MRVLLRSAWFARVVLFSAGATLASAQWHPAGRDARFGPMLDQGLVRYETPDLTLRLVKSSGTLRA
ncbi:MAG TPA: hypothetical protein VGI45_27610 [Terracidiphilus sp.]